MAKKLPPPPLPYAILVCKECDPPLIISTGHVRKASHRIGGKVHQAQVIEVDPVPMEPLEKMDAYLKRLAEVHREKIG